MTLEAIETLGNMIMRLQPPMPLGELTALNQGIEALEFRQRWEEQEGEKRVFVETKRLIGATYSFDDPWKGDEHYESI